MKRPLLILSAGITLLLSGCSLAPEYTRPDVTLPDTWPRGEAYKNLATNEENARVSQPAQSWRDYFPDGSLQKIIELSLENNHDLRLAVLNVERTRDLYSIQRAELYPTLNASGVGSKQRLSLDLIKAGEDRMREQYNVDLGIAAWEIDLFGRMRLLKDQALEIYLASEETMRQARIALIAEVAGTYLTLAADRERLRLAQSTLETQRSSHALMQKLFDQGMATELDLKRAQIPMDMARIEVARLTGLVAQDLNALNLLAATTVPEELLPADLSGITPPRYILPNLPSDVLLRRPDIMAAEHQLKGADAIVAAARAALFPRISLTTSIGSASDELGGLFGTGTGVWSFVPKIVIPIFDARTKASYRVSDTDRKIALTRYEKAIQTAFREVADTLAVQGTIEEQLSAQESLVNTADKAYDLAQKRYSEGIDSYLDVLDTQRILVSAQQGMVSLKFGNLTNLTRLYSVLGGEQGKAEQAGDTDQPAPSDSGT
ncbi:MAG: efflux transporter outer membrane subunit [Desulfobulbaceae bacterium]|nr:efflux transporter outer membrane subunit [Desulfobulbaceae bacterium]